jgi:N-acetylmuramoyl-L-alanine amidase
VRSIRRTALYVAVSAAVIILSAVLIEAATADPAPGAADHVALDDLGRSVGAVYAHDAAGRRASLEAGGRTAEFVVGLDGWRAGDEVRPLPAPARIGPAGVVEIPAEAAADVSAYLRGAAAPRPPAARRAEVRGAEPSRPRAPAPFIRTIVVDAGHGGHDGGAVSRHRRAAHRIREKDVNLAIAVRLAEALGRRHGARIVLTRDRDVFVPLPDRVRVAREADADLFISIHGNAVRGRRALTATGTEVYFFGRPTDEDAALLAEAEGAFEVEKSDIDPVLWDLMLAGNVIESNALAREVAARLPGAVGLPNRGVKSAKFYVLHYGVVSNIPSILVEVGFVSNPTEADRLARPAVQAKAAEAIADAVLAYLEALDLRHPGGRGWRRD